MIFTMEHLIKISNKINVQNDWTIFISSWLIEHMTQYFDGN